MREAKNSENLTYNRRVQLAHLIENFSWKLQWIKEIHKGLVSWLQVYTSLEDDRLKKGYSGLNTSTSFLSFLCSHKLMTSVSYHVMSMFSDYHYSTLNILCLHLIKVHIPLCSDIYRTTSRVLYSTTHKLYYRWNSQVYSLWQHIEPHQINSITNNNSHSKPVKLSRLRKYFFT